jgi:Holliday junction DNA helicase RuvA
MSGLLEYLEGPVAERGEDYLVVALGGVGLRITVPPRTAQAADPALVKLYTHLIVRDDSLELYGFGSREEREMFVGLLAVPQLGPRLAFRLVAALPPEEFIAAIRAGDLSALEQVKGIGRRTAQRVLVELAGRLSKLAPPATTPLSEKEQVVLKALTSKALGFSEAEVRKALESVRGELTQDMAVEEMIRRVLSVLSGP